MQQTSSPSKSLISKPESKLFNFRTIATAAEEAADKVTKDFKDLSLVCVDGACNTTKSKSDLNTDIVVQITTNNAKENETEVKGAEPDADVPVVAGTAGVDSLASRRIDSQITTKAPVFIPYAITPRPDGYQLTLPLDPNYNNHHFGENPPPMYVWYKRRVDNVYNPHAFNPNSRPHWKTNRPFSDWQRSYTNTYVPTRRTTPTGWTPSTICTCSNPGLNWYPSDDKIEG